MEAVADLRAQVLFGLGWVGASGWQRQELNISSVSQELFPLLTGRSLPFEEALDWLQFVYIADWTGGLRGAYVHVPFSFHAGVMVCALSSLIPAPAEALPGILRSLYAWT